MPPSCQRARSHAEERHAHLHRHSTSSPPPSARSSGPATGSRSTRTASTCSPTPPTTTSGSTSTRSARRPGPFGGTIAHGYLTLSPDPRAQQPGLRPRDRRARRLNYGLNKVRFPTPGAGRHPGPRARHARRGHRHPGRQAADRRATRSRSRARTSRPAWPRPCPAAPRLRLSGTARSLGQHLQTSSAERQRRRRPRLRQPLSAAGRRTPLIRAPRTAPGVASLPTLGEP